MNSGQTARLFGDNSIQEVACLDLSPLRHKLQCPQEGICWSDEVCDVALREYRRFLTLVCLHPAESIVPSQFIDAVWHQHILHTRLYHRDMERVFGLYLHHDPTFGLGGPAEKARLEKAFARTCALYLECFGERLQEATKKLGQEAPSCSSMCSSACTKLLANAA